MVKPEMLKCEHCQKEFEVQNGDILAVSSELMEAVVVCAYCKDEIIVKMVNKSVSDEKA